MTVEDRNDSHHVSSRSREIDAASRHVGKPWRPHRTLLAAVIGTIILNVVIWPLLKLHPLLSEFTKPLAIAASVCSSGQRQIIPAWLAFGNSRFITRLACALVASAILNVCDFAAVAMSYIAENGWDSTDISWLSNLRAGNDFFQKIALIPFQIISAYLVLLAIRTVWKWRFVAPARQLFVPDGRLSISDFLAGLTFAAAFCGGMRFVFDGWYNELFSAAPKLLLLLTVDAAEALVILPPLLWLILKPSRLGKEFWLVIAYETSASLVLLILSLFMAGIGIDEFAPLDFAAFLVLPATLITLACIARRAGYRLAVGNDPHQFDIAAVEPMQHTAI